VARHQSGLGTRAQGAHSITLPMSKDNVFAVRGSTDSYSASGSGTKTLSSALTCLAINCQLGIVPQTWCTR
jgi:hypothetical protein